MWFDGYCPWSLSAIHGWRSRTSHGARSGVRSLDASRDRGGARLYSPRPRAGRTRECFIAPSAASTVGLRRGLTHLGSLRSMEKESEIVAMKKTLQDGKGERVSLLEDEHTKLN